MEFTNEKLIETLILISMLAESLAKQMMVKDNPDKRKAMSMVTLYEIDSAILKCVDSNFGIGEFMYAEISPSFSFQRYIALAKEAENIVGTDGMMIINYIWLQKEIRGSFTYKETTAGVHYKW